MGRYLIVSATKGITYSKYVVLDMHSLKFFRTTSRELRGLTSEDKIDSLPTCPMSRLSSVGFRARKRSIFSFKVNRLNSEFVRLAVYCLEDYVGEVTVSAHSDFVNTHSCVAVDNRYGDAIFQLAVWFKEERGYVDSEMLTVDITNRRVYLGTQGLQEFTFENVRSNFYIVDVCECVGGAELVAVWDCSDNSIEWYTTSALRKVLSDNPTIEIYGARDIKDSDYSLMSSAEARCFQSGRECLVWLYLGGNKVLSEVSLGLGDLAIKSEFVNKLFSVGFPRLVSEGVLRWASRIPSEPTIYIVCEYNMFSSEMHIVTRVVEENREEVRGYLNRNLGSVQVIS